LFPSAEVTLISDGWGRSTGLNRFAAIALLAWTKGFDFFIFVADAAVK
jgi:hypothetical protein